MRYAERSRPGGSGPGRSVDVDRHLQPSRPDLRHEVVELLEARPCPGLDALRLDEEHVEQPPQLVHPGATDRLDGGQRASGPPRHPPAAPGWPPAPAARSPPCCGPPGRAARGRSGPARRRRRHGWPPPGPAPARCCGRPGRRARPGGSASTGPAPRCRRGSPSRGRRRRPRRPAAAGGCRWPGCPAPRPTCRSPRPSRTPRTPARRPRAGPRTRPVPDRHRVTCSSVTPTRTTSSTGNGHRRAQGRGAVSRTTAAACTRSRGSRVHQTWTWPDDEQHGDQAEERPAGQRRPVHDPNVGPVPGSPRLSFGRCPEPVRRQTTPARGLPSVGGVDHSTSGSTHERLRQIRPRGRPPHRPRRRRDPCAERPPRPVGPRCLRRLPARGVVPAAVGVAAAGRPRRRVAVGFPAGAGRLRPAAGVRGGLRDHDGGAGRALRGHVRGLPARVPGAHRGWPDLGYPAPSAPAVLLPPAPGCWPWRSWASWRWRWGWTPSTTSSCCRRTPPGSPSGSAPSGPPRSWTEQVLVSDGSR